MKNIIRKAAVAAMLVGTIGAASLVGSPEPASAAINTGAIARCLNHSQGEFVLSPSGSLYCSYYGGLYEEQIW